MSTWADRQDDIVVDSGIPRSTLQALLAKWREKIGLLRELQFPVHDPSVHDPDTLTECADDLAAILAAESEPK